MKNSEYMWKGLLLFLFIGPVQAMAIAQTPREAPLMKSTRTLVHKAVRKDTAWTTGVVVDQIYYVRYDKKGRKAVENLLNPDGSAKTKLIYVYGKDDRIKEEITASVKKNGISRIYQYNYDDKGRLNGKVALNAQREVVLRDTVLRDEQDRIVKRINESVFVRMDNEKKTKNIREVEIVYSNDGHVEEVLESDSSLPNPNKIRRALQKRDTAALKRFSDGDSMKPRIPKYKKVTFEYDGYGNWVKRTEYDGVNPEFIVLRTIEYAGQDTDRDEMRLNGKVKSVVQTSYVAVPKGPGSIDKGVKKGCFFRCEFDEKGRKILEQTYSDTGVPGQITEYAYDEEDRVMEEKRRSPVGELLGRIEWAYDAAGVLKNKRWLDAGGEVVRKGIFRYDVEGNCVSEIWFNKDGSKFSEFRYRYDPVGRLMAKDVLCHQVEGEEYIPLKRAWNTRGRLVEELKGVPPQVRRFTYKYSTRGDVIGGTEPENGQKEVTYVYKFYNDGQGNWLKRVKFVADVPILYEERKYTYYK